MKVIDLAKTFLATVIVAYIGVIIYFSFFGGIRIDHPITIILDDLDKPYQILACTVFIYLLIGIEPASVRLYAGRSWALVRDNFLSILLALTIIFGLAIRLWGLDHGIEYNHYSNIAHKFYSAFYSYLHNDYFFSLESGNREFLGYPFFPAHFAEFIFRFMRWFIGIIGFDYLAINIEIFTGIGRALNIIFTTIILFLIYRLGYIIKRKEVALLAVFFFSASIIQNHVVKDTIGDMSMSFFSMVAIYFMMKNIRYERKLNYILAGVFAGLSFASKYNGLLTFVLIGFIYLNLHPNRKEFTRHLALLFSSVVAFILTFIYTSANMLTFPEKTVRAIRIALDYSSRFATDTEVQSNSLALLTHWFSYHMWVFEGIIAPLPLWLFTAALGLVIIRYRWEYSYLWAGSLVIFLIGKLSMPVSAPIHYLLIQPFLFLTAALGIFEALKLIPVRVGQVIALASLCVFIGYHSIQDNSLWLLKPPTVSYQSWALENVTESDAVIWNTTPPPHISFDEWPAPDNSHIVRQFNNGARRAYSLFRGGWISVYVKSEHGFPLFPTVHFMTDKYKEYIYPKQHDIVTTDKAFVTYNDTLNNVKRFILAEGASQSIVIWVKNISDKESKVFGYGAGEKFSYTLRPNESTVHIVEKPKRTSLYYGKLMEVSVGSTSKAIWMIGANDEDVGDILLAAGMKKKALLAYLKADTLTSLLKAKASSPSSPSIDSLLRRRYPGIMNNDKLPGDQLFWESVAGYSDEFFASKMSKTIDYKPGMRRNSKEYGDGWIVFENGMLWGPYTTLLHGDYKLTIESDCAKNAKSFAMDVVSDKGQKIITERTISCGEADNGIDTLNFSIDLLMENLVEFRIHSVLGGKVEIKKVTLTIDYQRSIYNLMDKAKRAGG